MNTATRNAKTMRALGIIDLEYRRNRGVHSIYAVTLRDGKVLEVEVPIFGSTDTTVLRKAAEMLKDRPVRYA